ncbi:MAG TPA: pyroglutamyl-peptidase I [Opitutaceae bacterium]|nr:pyroglutamyl-peptidase I [Opitutaceae bacterium]
MTVLVTGFEPFDGESINPSERVAQAVAGRTVAGARVSGDVLPCVFGKSADRLADAITRLNPAVVICLGQAGGRRGIQLERVALNLADARIPDNEGNQPVNQRIETAGPVAYWSGLPLVAMEKELSGAGLPVAFSLSAGAFVCNHLFYSLMHRLTHAGISSIRAGFIHLPWLPEQAGALRGEPSLSLEKQITAVEILIESALKSLGSTAA